jgi:ATP-dependent DNA helicase RecQ
MKDQVANLQQRIKAIALTGGIRQDELIDLLDNCQYGITNFYICHQNAYSPTGF